MPINYNEYPPNWKAIRERILLREDNKCKFCGAPNHEFVYRPIKGQSGWLLMPEGHYADALALDGVKFTKVILTIAHLDHDRLNHDVNDDRLAALCQRCHLQYDLPRHINNRRYGRNYLRDQYQLF